MAFWMITNRKVEGSGNKRSLGSSEDGLSFWTSDAEPAGGRLSSWTQRSDAEFRNRLVKAARRFPRIDDPARHEEQQHVTLFIHGFNNSWSDATRRYFQLVRDMYSGPSGLGECILFTWPSDGLKVGYYPDRLDARRTADELADVLTSLYTYLEGQQMAAMKKGRATCRAKLSVIAHSMGAYVLQKGMQHVWTRRNQPLLISLVNQLVLVAADIDNDLFRSGEEVDRGDGDAIANLTYRVSALYTGLDSTLGLSAGFKHFGKRRLGRSGLDRKYSLPDNVWDVDCTGFLKGVPNTHSAYFDTPSTRLLMADILRGLDRRVLSELHRIASSRDVTAEAAAVAERP